MKTLLLDVSSWDLVLDAAGNIAIAAEPYAVAQDVASAIKLFAGELWYDTTKGVPYFASILGKSPPVEFYKAANVAAALTVPTVVSASCTISSFQNRTVGGSVTFRRSDGTSNTVQFQ